MLLPLIRNLKIRSPVKMKFKRKLYDALLKWKNESRGHRALLIEGAKRVGKSMIPLSAELPIVTIFVTSRKWL